MNESPFAREPCQACGKLDLGRGQRLAVRKAQDGCGCLMCDPCAHGAADEFTEAIKCSFLTGTHEAHQRLESFCRQYGVVLTANDLSILRSKPVHTDHKVEYLECLSAVFDSPKCSVHRTNPSGITAQIIWNAR